MIRISIAVAATLLSAAASNAAPADKKPEEPNPPVFISLGDSIDAGRMRFITVRPTSTSDMVERHDPVQRLLVVYFENAPDRPKGVSHAVIEREAACPDATVARLAYTSYAANGKVVTRAKSLPPGTESLLDSAWVEAEFKRGCSPPGPMPPPAPWPQYSVWALLFQPTATWPKDVASAVRQARAHEAAIAEAKQLPEAGTFVLSEAKDGLLAIVDHATLAAPGGKKRVSWIHLGMPEVDGGKGYIRARFDVDCDAETATPDLIARFDGTGKLIKAFERAEKEKKFKHLEGIQTLLRSACQADGKLPERTYSTFTEALAAGRAMLGQ